jgi:hypothetical protein
MSGDREELFDERVAGWLSEDPEAAPHAVLETVVAAVRLVPQRRRLGVLHGRVPPMLTRTAAGLAAALIVVVAVIFLGRSPGGVGSGSIQPSIAVSPSPLASATPAAAAPTATPGTPSPLDGTWTSEFTGAATEKSPDGHQIPEGTWTLTFIGDGTGDTAQMGLINPTGEHGGGPVQVQFLPGDLVVLPPDNTCSSPATTGTYHYVRTATSLTFTAVAPADSCADRTTTLTAHPWTLVP